MGRRFKSIWNQYIDSICRWGLWKGLAESHIFPYPMLNGLNLSMCQNTALQGLQTQQVWDRTHYPCLANTYYYWVGGLQLLLQLLLLLFPLIVSYFPYHLLRRWWIICLWRQLQCYAKQLSPWEAERVLSGNIAFYSHDHPHPKYCFHSRLPFYISEIIKHVKCIYVRTEFSLTTCSEEKKLILLSL